MIALAISFVALGWLGPGGGRAAHAALRVVTTIETLGALASEIGGSRVEVQSLSHGYQDPHFVPAKPSLILTLNRADALIYVGLDLESGWLPPLIQQSRNPKIQAGQPGHINGSAAIHVEEIPNIPADQMRALGDVHPLGNPHYWLPPDNARALAELICKRLGALDPAGTPEFEARLRDFTRRLGAKTTAWKARAAGLKGLKVVTYHKSWTYFTEWLGMEEVGYVEPKPGTPPTAFHTAELVKVMRQLGVSLIIMENFYPRSLADIIGRETGARVLALPANVGGTPAAKTYFDLVDGIVSALVGAAQDARGTKPAAGAAAGAK